MTFEQIRQSLFFAEDTEEDPSEVVDAPLVETLSLVTCVVMEFVNLAKRSLSFRAVFVCTSSEILVSSRSSTYAGKHGMK